MVLSELPKYESGRIGVTTNPFFMCLVNDHLPLGVDSIYSLFNSCINSGGNIPPLRFLPKCVLCLSFGV